MVPGASCRVALTLGSKHSGEHFSKVTRSEGEVAIRERARKTPFHPFQRSFSLTQAPPNRLEVGRSSLVLSHPKMGKQNPKPRKHNFFAASHVVVSVSGFGSSVGWSQEELEWKGGRERSGDRPYERSKATALPGHAELLMAPTNVSTLSHSRPALPAPEANQPSHSSSCTVSVWTSERAVLPSRNPKLAIPIHSVMHTHARTLVRDLAFIFGGELTNMGCKISIAKFEVQSFRASLTEELKCSAVSESESHSAYVPVSYGAGSPRARDAQPVAEVHHGGGRRSRRRRQHLPAPAAVALRRLLRREGKPRLSRRLYRGRNRRRGGRGSWKIKQWVRNGRDNKNAVCDYNTWTASGRARSS